MKISFSTQDQGHKDTDFCNTNQVYRKTDIKVICDEAATGSPNAADFKVTEPKGPKGVNTRLSCALRTRAPHSGRSSQRKVCDGRSLPDDTGKSSVTTDNTARCFCNNGWGGAACDASGDADHNAVASDMGGAIALLVILFLLMLGLGAVLYNLMKQVKGYRDDTANYLALQEDGGAGAF